jgi:hypothetical protein
MKPHARPHHALLAHKTHSRTSCHPRSIPMSSSASRLRSGSCAAHPVHARKDTTRLSTIRTQHPLLVGSLRPGPTHIRPHTHPSTRRYEQHTSASGLRTGTREPAYMRAMTDTRRSAMTVAPAARCSAARPCASPVFVRGARVRPRRPAGLLFAEGVRRDHGAPRRDGKTGPAVLLPVYVRAPHEHLSSPHVQSPEAACRDALRRSRCLESWGRPRMTSLLLNATPLR